jgi:hypothetical protein
VRGGYNSLATDDGDDEDEGDDSLDGFFVGPTAGGSYYFADFFSIGGDVELRYTQFSEEEDFGDESVSTTSSTITIKPSLVVRFFF